MRGQGLQNKESQHSSSDQLVRDNFDSRSEDNVLPENQSSQFKDDMLSRTSSISSSQLSAFSYKFKL